MSDTAPAKIFQMHIDWTRFGQDWRNILVCVNVTGGFKMPV